MNLPLPSPLRGPNDARSFWWDAFAIREPDGHVLEAVTMVVPCSRQADAIVQAHLLMARNGATWLFVQEQGAKGGPVYEHRFGAVVHVRADLRDALHLPR